jgi:hypothetical protein
VNCAGGVNKMRSPKSSSIEAESAGLGDALLTSLSEGIEANRGLAGSGMAADRGVR